MAARTIMGYLKQTYASANRRLYILDSGVTPGVEALPDCYPDFNITYHRVQERNRSIGELRNYANNWATKDGAEILCHMDDDDWSAPTRIECQVKHLIESGAPVVGFNSMLFWNSQWNNKRVGLVNVVERTCEVEDLPSGEAWIYTNPNPRYCLGTSLMYWRSVWEQFNFEDVMVGEDQRFLFNKKSQGREGFWYPNDEGHTMIGPNPEPLMIAEDHGGNTCKRDRATSAWHRAPEWDDFTRETMTLG